MVEVARAAREFLTLATHRVWRYRRVNMHSGRVVRLSGGEKRRLAHGSRAHRKPRLMVELSGVFEVRAATR